MNHRSVGVVNTFMSPRKSTSEFDGIKDIENEWKDGEDDGVESLDELKEEEEESDEEEGEEGY